MKPIAKVRGKEEGPGRGSYVLENIADDRVVIAHADADQMPKIEWTALADGRVKEVLIEPYLGPVIATHVGPGTLALFGFAKTTEIKKQTWTKNKLKSEIFSGKDIDFLA